VYKSGHLPGAKHIDAAGLAAGIEKLKLDRKNPVVLVCDTGNLSRKSASAVQKLGFVEVAALDGGVQAWKEAALPLIK
jgi:rhodanese-related sulfurtransferase